MMDYLSSRIHTLDFPTEVAATTNKHTDWSKSLWSGFGKLSSQAVFKMPKVYLIFKHFMRNLLLRSSSQNLCSPSLSPALFCIIEKEFLNNAQLII